MTPVRTGNWPSGYRTDIDGLRGFAVLSVIAYHAAPELVPGGFAGVDIFFVISGYLISGIIFRQLDAGTFDLANFYVRRIRRILPSLCVVLTCSLGIGWYVLRAGEFATFGIHVAAGAAFLSNVLLWLETGYFDVGAEFKPLLHLWSLSVEEQFYLLWPLAVCLAWKGRHDLFRLTLLIATISFALNVVLLDDHATSTFFLPHTRLWELLGGALVACIEFRSGPRPGRADASSTNFRPISEAGKLRESAGLAGLLATFASVFILSWEQAYPGWHALLPVLGTSAIILTGTRLNTAILSNRALVGIGLISYPLYLWHWPLLSFTRIASPSGVSIAAVISAVALAFVLAWLTYRFVEIPVRFGVASKARRTPYALMGALAIIGLTGVMTTGLHERAQRSEAEALRAPITPSRRTSRDCKPEFPSTVVRSCVQLPSDPRPKRTILIVGDSHSSALALGIGSGSKTHLPDARYVEIGINGCLPFAGIERFTQDGPLGCAKVLEEMLRIVSEDSGADTIYIVARYAVYLSGAGFGIDAKRPRGNAHIQRTGPRLSRARVDYPEVFRFGLKMTLDTLASKPVQVVLVHQVPELGFDPKSCLSPPPAQTGGAGKFCAVARKDVVARQTQYRTIVDSVLSYYPAVKTFDPLPLFCDETHCYGMKGDVLLYADNNHLNLLGAALLLEKAGIR